MITRKDVMPVNFLKKEKFTGSDTGMRYRMEMTKREVPKEDGADGETVEETVLTVTSWPEPYGYDATPEEEKEKMPEQYETVSLDDFVEYSKSMFEYWTEDDFASSFRKMLTIEQFRSEEMQKLYQQYLVAGPASYVKALFESIGIVNAKDKAARFYAVMHFYYSLYDGAADKEKVKVEFVSAIKSLVQDLA